MDDMKENKVLNAYSRVTSKMIAGMTGLSPSDISNRKSRHADFPKNLNASGAAAYWYVDFLWWAYQHGIKVDGKSVSRNEIMRSQRFLPEYLLIKTSGDVRERKRIDTIFLENSEWIRQGLELLAWKQIEIPIKLFVQKGAERFRFCMNLSNHEEHDEDRKELERFIMDKEAVERWEKELKKYERVMLKYPLDSEEVSRKYYELKKTTPVRKDLENYLGKDIGIEEKSFLDTMREISGILWEMHFQGIGNLDRFLSLEIYARPNEFSLEIMELAGKKTIMIQDDPSHDFSGDMVIFALNYNNMDEAVKIVIESGRNHLNEVIYSYQYPDRITPDEDYDTLEQKICGNDMERLERELEKGLIDELKKKLTAELEKASKDELKKKLTDELKKKLYELEKASTDELKKEVLEKNKSIVDSPSSAMEPENHFAVLPLLHGKESLRVEKQYKEKLKQLIMDGFQSRISIWGLESALEKVKREDAIKFLDGIFKILMPFRGEYSSKEGEAVQVKDQSDQPRIIFKQTKHNRVGSKEPEFSYKIQSLHDQEWEMIMEKFRSFKADEYPEPWQQYLIQYSAQIFDKIFRYAPGVGHGCDPAERNPALTMRAYEMIFADELYDKLKDYEEPRNYTEDEINFIRETYCNLMRQNNITSDNWNNIEVLGANIYCLRVISESGLLYLGYKDEEGMIQKCVGYGWFFLAVVNVYADILCATAEKEDDKEAEAAKDGYLRKAIRLARAYFFNTFGKTDDDWEKPVIQARDRYLKYKGGE